MADLIRLKHRETGVEKQGIYGFSWTILFFGALPMLMRGDFATFLGYLPTALLALYCLGLGGGVVSAILGGLIIHLVCAFKYNKYYTTRLLEKGYQLAGVEKKNAEAAQALNLGAAQAYFAEASTRKCPFCAEQVKAEAIVCRFCHRDLPERQNVSKGAPDLSDTPAQQTDILSAEQKSIMERFGIEYRDGLFFYEGRGYSTLSNIPFGKKHG